LKNAWIIGTQSWHLPFFLDNHAIISITVNRLAIRPHAKFPGLIPIKKKSWPYQDGKENTKPGCVWPEDPKKPEIFFKKP
jgi:hypothetical protein